MEELDMYHGAIGKERAERILGAAGRDGSFLIRDSDSVPGTYCVCVLFDRCIFTYRIIRVAGDVWKTETAPGVKERLFRNVRNLLAAYETPDQGIAVPLRFPVKRTPARRAKTPEGPKRLPR